MTSAALMVEKMREAEQRITLLREVQAEEDAAAARPIKERLRLIPSANKSEHFYAQVITHLINDLKESALSGSQRQFVEDVLTACHEDIQYARSRA